MNEERLHRIWEEEDPFIDDFEDAFVKILILLIRQEVFIFF